jgi:hypothetical protein
MFGNEKAGIAVPKVAKVKGICDLIGERLNARELVKVCASVKHLEPVRKGKLNKSLPVGYFNAASVRNHEPSPNYVKAVSLFNYIPTVCVAKDRAPVVNAKATEYAKVASTGNNAGLDFVLRLVCNFPRRYGKL